MTSLSQETLLWLLLGVIQGVTEWLPISSKTQLMLFGMTQLGMLPAEAFSAGLLLQGGTAIAVVYVFRKDIGSLVGALPRLFSREDDEWVALLRFLIVMTLITGIVGLPLLLALKTIISSWSTRTATLFTGLSLLLTASILRIRSRSQRKSSGSRQRLSTRDSILAGVVQSFSVLPGISRSGVTLAFFGLRGLESEESFRLSFISSIPATLGSSFLEILLDRELLGLPGMGTNLLISAVFSLITGLLVIRLLLGVSRRANMDLLCAALGASALIWSLLPS